MEGVKAFLICAGPNIGPFFFSTFALFLRKRRKRRGEKPISFTQAPQFLNPGPKLVVDGEFSFNFENRPPHVRLHVKHRHPGALFCSFL